MNEYKYKMLLWLVQTLRWSIRGAIIGVVIGLLLVYWRPMGRDAGFLIINRGALFGALAFGLLPLLFSVWFAFLYMMQRIWPKEEGDGEL